MKINEALHYFKQGYLNESFCCPSISALISTQDGDVSHSFSIFLLESFNTVGRRKWLQWKRPLLTDEVNIQHVGVGQEPVISSKIFISSSLFFEESFYHGINKSHQLKIKNNRNMPHMFFNFFLCFIHWWKYNISISSKQTSLIYHLHNTPPMYNSLTHRRNLPCVQ